MESPTLLSRPLLTPEFVRAVMVVALAVACLAVAPRAEARGEEVARAPSGVMYVSGGVGIEAVELLKSMQKNFRAPLIIHVWGCSVRSPERSNRSVRSGT